MIQGVLTNLRAVDRSDLDRIHAWLDDPELMRAWGYGAPAPSRANSVSRIEEWIAEEQTWNHPVAFIVETLEGKPCGLVALSRLSATDRSCDLSLFIERSFRGMRFGADIVETIVDAAFSQWNLHRVSVQCEEHNTGAQAFFLHQGFTREGQMREARYLDGTWHDIFIFGRLRSDEKAEQ